MTRLGMLVVAGVAAVVCCLAFVFQGSRGIWQPDEGYYVGTSVTMVEKDTLLIPFLGEDEIFLDKPPMVYWSIIAGMELFGHTEFAVRFFHGTAFVLTSLVTGLLAWRMYRSARMAILSVFIYATMVVPFFAANFVTPDTLLTLWTTLAMLCFWESTQNKPRIAFWQMLLALTLGLGFLAKGPAVFIPCGAMFVFLIVRKQLGDYFLSSRMLAAILFFLAVGLGWYVYVSVEVPGSLAYLFESQLWGRLISEKFKRNPGLTGALIYVPVILLGTMPWSILWLERTRSTGRAIFGVQWWRALGDRPAELLLTCWFVVPIIVLVLSSSKLGLYALPLFPMLAISTARVWDSKLPRVSRLGLWAGLAVYKRHIAVCSAIALVLLLGKFGLANMPSASDMRLLAEHLKNHLPEGPYELGTVDKRADGLLFYGVREVEHLTDESNPYPTFSGTENVLAEIAEYDQTEGTLLLLVMGRNKTQELSQTLRKGNIRFSTVELQYGRRLLTLQSHQADQSHGPNSTELP